MARPGTIAAQSEQPEIVTVPAMDDMTRPALIRHCRARHSTLRMITPENHAADHRLRPEVQDHVHGGREEPETDEEVMVDLDPPGDEIAEEVPPEPRAATRRKR